MRRPVSRRRLEPRKQPVQRRSQVTVDALLEAAAQVFEAHGYAAGTTNRIAERAGVSIGTLYQYFPNKEALAVALLERHLAEAMRRLNDWVGRSVPAPRSLRDTLGVFIDGMLDLHADRSRLQHVLLEETPLPPQLHDTILRVEQDVARTVAGLLRLYPEVRHDNLGRAAILAVQAVETLTHRFAAHPELGLSRRAFAAELAAMLEAYLTKKST